MTIRGITEGIEGRSVRVAAASILGFLLLVLLVGCLTPVVAGAAGTKDATSGRGLGPAPYSQSKLPAIPAMPPIIEHVPEAGKRVALTFDAGWEWSNTVALLDLLSQRGVKATFFLRGGWVVDHPDLVKAIAGAGHVIESHSFTHPDMTKLSPEGARKELTETEDALIKTAGIKVTLFRPPYGAYNQEMLRALGERGYRAMVMWDVDSLDWTGLAKDKLTDRVLSGVKPGSIVLMHIGGANTVKALPAILDGLASRGLRTVTVPELLSFAKALPGPTAFPASSGRSAGQSPSGLPADPNTPAFSDKPGSSEEPATPAAGPARVPGSQDHAQRSGLGAAVAFLGGVAGRLFLYVHHVVALALSQVESIVRGLGRFLAG